MQVHLLGGVTAVTDAGVPLDIGPAKCRAVLAVLALAVGEAVPVPRLVDAVWGEDPPRTADKTLQGYVARLRRSLGPDTIERAGAAYRLDLDPEAVDVARFRRLLQAGDVDGALAAWIGTPLAGLHVPGLMAAADGLVEQWLDAMEDQLGRRVDTDAAGAIAPLTELAATHPFREELWALLLTACTGLTGRLTRSRPSSGPAIISSRSSAWRRDRACARWRRGSWSRTTRCASCRQVENGRHDRPRAARPGR